MSSSDSTQTQTVTTPLDDVEHDAALAASLDPEETEIVGADVTPDNELKLTLEGPKL